MKDLTKTSLSEIYIKIFQQITGSYYLIPSIEKFLKRILEIINSGLSLYSGFIYYAPIEEKKIIIKDHSIKDQNSLHFKLSEMSEIIFKENYPGIYSTKRHRFDINLEACVIPVRYESIPFGLIILFGDNNSFSPENIIEDSIGTYVTAACLGNRLLATKENILNSFFGTNVIKEISVKTLLELRIQEIIKNFFDQILSEQNIYKEISQETEKTIITVVLKEADNNQSRAAKYLGINRNTLRKKIKELNIN